MFLSILFLIPLLLSGSAGSLFLGMLFVFFVSLFSQESYFLGIVIDLWSGWFVPLSILLGVFCLAVSNDSKEKELIIIISIFSGVGFFLTDNIFIMFVLFEISVVPLLILMLIGGGSPERVTSSRFFIIYTIISSSPFFVYSVGSAVSGESTLFYSLLSTNSSGEEMFLLVFVSFFVNIPVFFFHSWLPNAHVESSLEGSIILAGLMLKLGVYGIIRILPTFMEWNEFVLLSLSVCFVGSVYSVLASLNSDDLKISVAFSSISHMNFATACFFSISGLSEFGFVITIFAHGISSPLLFFLVTSIYKLTNSRSVIVSKGTSNIPLVFLISAILWSLNFSIPPSLSFIGEIALVISVLSFLSWSFIPICLFVVLNSFFSVLNLGVESHSSSNLHLNGSFVPFSFPLLGIFGSGVLFILPLALSSLSL